MTQVNEAFALDANGNPVTYKGMMVTKKVRAYTGAAGLGAQGAATLFTVTGDIIGTLIAVCSEDLAGALATIEAGIAGNTAALIAQTTATNIDVGEIWVDTGPATIESVPADKIIAAGTDVIETIATADITDGTLIYYLIWAPLSADANVVAA